MLEEIDDITSGISKSVQLLCFAESRIVSDVKLFVGDGSVSMCKKRVIIFAEYYLPGFKAGGPIQTIPNIVELLGDKYEFHIITGDRDWSDCEGYKNVNIDCWNDVGKAKVYYLSQECQNWAKISELLQSNDYELIYLNSFCSLVFSIIP